MNAHFDLSDFIESDTATRLGIVNVPSLEIVTRINTVVIPAMEDIRDYLGGNLIRVNSGYRCEALERVIARADYESWCARRGRAVNAAASWAEYFARKQHPRGYAVDWTCRGYGAPLDIVRALAARPIDHRWFDQLIQEGTWVHISFAPEMRGEVLTARFGSTGVTYQKGA